jgi:3-phosphoshikimate 1-carboxyvinyltransferase
MQVQKMDYIKIEKNEAKISGRITPPASKSESNRVLIIDALADYQCKLDNLSNARDTQTMIRLLNSNDKVLDVIDAGTTMRFLTAYLSITGQEKVLTGTKRMCERPIKLLVDALRSLGAGIGYMQQEGYPPLEIQQFDKRNVKSNYLKMKGDVSSQYITALLMIAPSLPEGLVMELEGKVGSRPYIEMTLSLMKHFGVVSDWTGNTITITHQAYIPGYYKVESDWSASSYWYSVVALAEDASIELIGYQEHSLQGDSAIVKLMDMLGVKTTFTKEGIYLEKKSAATSITYDFTDSPDLAQTIAVVCAAKGIPCRMHGLESLRIKETDRITALNNELKKFGSGLDEIEKDKTYDVKINTFKVSNQEVATYKDHRMAMAFAPLATIGNILIEHPEVVEKSYPHFWEDFKAMGFKL